MSLEAQADALKPPPVREGFDEFLRRKGSGRFTAEGRRTLR